VKSNREVLWHAGRKGMNSEEGVRGNAHGKGNIKYNGVKKGERSSEELKIFARLQGNLGREAFPEGKRRGSFQ